MMEDPPGVLTCAHAVQDLGSNVEISLDGKKLEKNKEYQISVGQELKIGNDATYQVRHLDCCKYMFNFTGQWLPHCVLESVLML